VKFLVDNQLPAALARFLSSRGVDCQHVLDLGLDQTSDAKIWEYACREDCVVISKDEDFLYLASGPGTRGRFLWIRLGNCRRTVLLDSVARAWAQIEAVLQRGERIIELR
jgi:predicted nuclease of predicted toxin-antitoxin system